MGRDHTADYAKRLIRRRGDALPPTAAPIVPEVRTHAAYPIKAPDPQIQFELGTILIEWTFGVPYADVPAFHQFLVDNEQFIRRQVASVQGARYGGTYWSTGQSYHYRTFWVYDTQQTIAELYAAINASSNLYSAINTLRSYWASDPSRQEFIYQPAALTTARELEDYSASNPIVGMGLPSSVRTRRRASKRAATEKRSSKKAPTKRRPSGKR
jgi:hypothetical protein